VRSSVERQFWSKGIWARDSVHRLRRRGEGEGGYETHYVAERRAAGLPVDPFETVAERDEDALAAGGPSTRKSKVDPELRQKARIAIYRIPEPAPLRRTPILPFDRPARPTRPPMR